MSSILKHKPTGKHLIGSNTTAATIPDPCAGTLAGFRYYFYYWVRRGRVYYRIYMWYDNSVYLLGDALQSASWKINDGTTSVSGTRTANPFYSYHNVGAAGLDPTKPLTIEFELTTQNGCVRTHTATIEKPISHPRGWHSEQAIS